ncbi:hypothetical protein [Acinetobacter sp. M5A5_2a]
MGIFIAGGPWSGGRRGKLATKAWILDCDDVAEEMGYTIVRLKAAARFKINEFGPLQIRATFAS